MYAQFMTSRCHLDWLHVTIHQRNARPLLQRLYLPGQGRL